MSRTIAITKKIQVRFLLLLALSAGLGACATVETQSEDPAQLYKAAEEEISNDHFLMAIDKLRELKNKFPYSKYAIDAQLRLADVYFMQESYSEAAAAYEAFRDLHPRHEKAPYALFRSAKSHMNDSPEEIARDQASAERAVGAYAEFIAKHPSDALAAEARTDQQALQSRLAEKEFGVGEFYRKRGHLAAAQRRFERVVSRFPKTTAADRARKRLDRLNSEDSP